VHPGSWKLIRRPIDLYVVCQIHIYRIPAAAHSGLFQLALLLADVVQSLGHILSIRWISSGIVVEGSYCTVQGMYDPFRARNHFDGCLGITQQLGETAVAMTTLVRIRFATCHHR
jgi:hypothetical protein